MWMGIDVGTGGTRALLADEQGKIRASFTAPHTEMRMERPLWAEQHPENWWDAAVKAIRGILAESRVSSSDVRGIGLSGQMHGLVILDKSNQVIRPALIWCDQRSQEQVDAVNRRIGRAADCLHHRRVAMAKSAAGVASVDQASTIFEVEINPLAADDGERRAIAGIQAGPQEFTHRDLSFASSPHKTKNRARRNHAHDVRVYSAPFPEPEPHRNREPECCDVSDCI